MVYFPSPKVHIKQSSYNKARRQVVIRSLLHGLTCYITQDRVSKEVQAIRLFWWYSRISWDPRQGVDYTKPATIKTTATTTKTILAATGTKLKLEIPSKLLLFHVTSMENIKLNFNFKLSYFDTLLIGYIHAMGTYLPYPHDADKNLVFLILYNIQKLKEH